MFGLISKKKLQEILEFLYKNNDTEKTIGETVEERVRDFISAVALPMQLIMSATNSI